MLTRFDDYCIHQTTDPIAIPATTERNFYDRYWFNGFDRDGKFIFEIGFGVYPNRHVMDGHFSIVIDGVQHAFHASRRAPIDRSQTEIGPLKITILEPMRKIRFSISENDTGISCDLLFTARTVPVPEHKNVMMEGVRQIMNTSRFTQFGQWEGVITVAGRKIEVNFANTPGTRDKSWGYRPIGEQEGGAPGLLNGAPQVYWTWMPIHFDTFCTHYCTFQDAEGRPTQEGGSIVPVYANYHDIPDGDDPNTVHAKNYRHKITWQPGTRRAAKAVVQLDELEIELTPVLDFQMLAIGYQHPSWGHAIWHGELVIECESWELASLDKLDYKHIHTHQVVEAKAGNTVGVGTLETISFGAHKPSGFTCILDGAPQPV